MMADLQYLLAIYVHAHRTGNSVPPHIDAEARAALADEPAVPEGREPVAVTGQPSDEEIIAFWSDHCAGDGDAGIIRLARWGNPAPVPLADGEVDCISIDEMCEILRSLGIKAAEYTDCTILYELTFEQLRAICDTRAFALSRRTPAPPADGEVAELMEGLRLISDGMSAIGHDSDSWFVARAAKLLQRQALVPVPVPVSERLPGPEVCDAEHYCWRWNTIGRLWARQPLARSWYEFESHWLPAHALPIPHQQENAND